MQEKHTDKPVTAAGWPASADRKVATEAAVTGLPLVSPRASSAILMFAIAGAITVGALVRWGCRAWVLWGVGR